MNSDRLRMVSKIIENGLVSTYCFGVFLRSPIQNLIHEGQA